MMSAPRDPGGGTSIALRALEARYDAESVSANERLKARAAEFMWLGLIAATGLHFLILALWPPIEASVRVDHGAPRPLILALQERPALGEIPLPAKPRELDRPAIPVIAAETPPRMVQIPDFTDMHCDFGSASRMLDPDLDVTNFKTPR